MKTLMKSLALVTVLASTSAFAAAPAKPAAAAPTAAAPAGQVGVNGIAVANLEAILYNSVAFKKAQVDRETSYKAQFDAAKAREAQLTAQMKPLYDQFVKDRAAPNAAANQAALQAQAQKLQQMQEQAKAEIEKLVEPVRLSDAYVMEQIADKRAVAVVTAMNKSGVTLLLNPEAVLHVTNNAYNLNQAVLNELNAILPSVGVVPPAGWLPREVREQQAQQQAQQPAASAAASR
jgi:Skp family chaperone for outer membrane proteins